MFAALGQRIATRFSLKPMDLAESAACLRHHLALAGRVSHALLPTFVLAWRLDVAETVGAAHHLALAGREDPLFEAVGSRAGGSRSRPAD